MPSQSPHGPPAAASGDSGASWSSASLVNPGLADVPDALAARPGGDLIALTRGGAELGQHGGTWTHLSSSRALAATPAGRACGVGRPDRGGVRQRRGSDARYELRPPRGRGHLHRQRRRLARGRPGRAGLPGSGEHRGAPAGPGGHRPGGTAAGGHGPTASVIAAWYDGTRWTLSPLLRAGTVRSTAIGPDGSVGIILNATQAATLAGPGASWHLLPALPKWAATLALAQAGQVDAIAAHGGTFTDWRLAPAGWSPAQTINVTIPYGSSG